jgi:Derlin-2/3
VGLYFACYLHSLHSLIACYMLVQFSKQYESGGPFNTGAGGGTADYLFMLMFGAVMMLFTYPVVSMVLPVPPLFTRNLIYYVLYVWSKRHPTQQANIWGIPMPAIYLPFAYLALTVFMGNPFADMLHGLAVGHLYYFLADVVPQVQGRDVLFTPQFLIDKFGVGEYRPVAGNLAGGVPVQGVRPATGGAAAAAGGGHNWGHGGQRLGRD